MLVLVCTCITAALQVYTNNNTCVVVVGGGLLDGAAVQ
jgi:hypothetical protein